MKILWVCNFMLPKISKLLNKNVNVAGGWISGLLDDVLSHTDCEITVCYPDGDENAGNEGNFFYRGFGKEETLNSILSEKDYNAIHIFGTEYKTALRVTEICKDLNISKKVVISIQGMPSMCFRHYTSGLSHYVTIRKSFRDFLKNTNIRKEQKAFRKNGMNEIRAISNVKHIIGRTDWDRACTRQINPDAQYHLCNETLRKSFYENEWTLETCEKHSIFVTQCGYPLKGFHRALEALQIVLRFYPDAKLYTTGRSILNRNDIKSKLKLTYYEIYIKKLIKKYGLKENVVFLGPLDERKMCERYLKSHVFALTSSIENSPNSLGEAMMLGVPCVTADVGGVKTLFKHNEDGIIYQADAPYMLADAICKIFESDELAKMFSENAKHHANMIHNRENNLNTVMKIYTEIVKGE